MKNIKGFKLLELVIALSLCSLLCSIIIYITKDMYKLSEEISINDEIDEEVDIICRIFDEFSTDLKQNYRKFKMEEILVDDKPIIKLLIKNEVILTIYNYENKKIKYRENEWTFKHIRMFYILDFENKLIYAFVDEKYRYHRIIHNFYEVAWKR